MSLRGNVDTEAAGAAAAAPPAQPALPLCAHACLFSKLRQLGNMPASLCLLRWWACPPGSRRCHRAAGAAPRACSCLALVLSPHSPGTSHDMHTRPKQALEECLMMKVIKTPFSNPFP